jgi:Na+/melibiose symporter-like transporter
MTGTSHGARCCGLAVPQVRVGEVVNNLTSQSDVSIPGRLSIKVAAGIVPAAALAAATAVMLAYPLTEKAFRAVAAELAKRRATRAVYAPEVATT